MTDIFTSTDELIKQVKKDNPDRLPRDLHEQVLDKAEVALEKMANRFRSLSPMA